MNLKELCKQNKKSITALAAQCELPYSTVNDIVNGRIALENVAFGKCYKISRALGISMEDMAEYSISPGTIHLDEGADIIVRKQQYYLQYQGKHYYICKVTLDSTPYIEEMALWKMQEIQKKQELEELLSLRT